MRRLSTNLLLALLIAILSGCGEPHVPSPYRPLQEAGIQVLSTSNPYHGPNMLLGRTLEESPTLLGYFNYNGAPAAIEVRKASRHDEELLFYYPQDYKVYVASRSNDATRSDWMIAGPYGIGKQDYRRIKNFMDPSKESPIFLVHGSLIRYNSTPKVQKIAAFEPEIPLIAIPKPKPKPKKVVKKKPKDEEVITSQKGSTVHVRIPNLDDPKFIPQNSDQEALLLSRGYAPRADNGDILHDIEGNAQSLENIAHWYMGSAKMIAELQEANQFSESQLEVRKGTTVRIPLRFIKNTKKMPMNHRVAKAPEPKPEAKEGEKKASSPDVQDEKVEDAAAKEAE